MNSFRELPARSISDVLAAYNKSERTLGALRAQVGEGVVRAFLTLAIIDFYKFFSVDKGLDRMQVQQLIIDILQDYWYLTVDDFKVFFANCRRGMYGTVYNRLDGFVILEWIGKYAEERSAEAQVRNYVEATTMSGRDPYVRTSKSKPAAELIDQAKSKISR